MEALSISFSNQALSEESENLLRLEQEEWGKNVGVVTKNDALKAILALLQQTAMPVINCGLQDDMSIKCLIFAYPATPSLSYTLKPTRGAIIRSVRDRLEESEAIVFNNSNNASMNNYSDSVVSATWSGNVFDSKGVITSSPTISYDGNDVKLDKLVNGVLILKCNVVRDTWILSILPIDDNRNKYSSVVVGLYNNGISWVEVSPPPNADSLSEDTKCGWDLGGNNGGGTVNDDDDDGDGDGYDPPTDAPKEDRKIEVDYCLQIIISDSAS